MGDLCDLDFDLGEDVGRLQSLDDSEGFRLDMDDFSHLQGADDFYFDDDSVPTAEDEYLQGPAPKRARSALLGRTIKAAERSVVRIKSDEHEPLIFKGTSSSPPSASSKEPGTFGRRNREKGSTLPAYARKISHDLDSDDELIMNMHDMRFSDQQIAEKLKQDGRTSYTHKSIATRICRIRSAQAEHIEFLLKEGYKEWRLEDVSQILKTLISQCLVDACKDQLLMQAYDLADIDIRYEMERLRAWRFRKVAEYMRRLDTGALFSANSCRDRYSALIQGTATIPTDVDDNPDAKRKEREAFRKEREKVRAAEQNAKAEKEAEEQRVKEEARLRNARKAAETAARRNAVAQERADRAIARAAQASMRAQKSAEHNNKKAARHAAAESKRLADQAMRAEKSRERKKLKSLSLSAVKNVTDKTPDPRAGLSLADLHKLCRDRMIAVGSDGKADVVKRLRDADRKLKVTELRALCKSRGIGLGGSKIQMRHQLATAAAMECPSYRGPGAEMPDDEEMLDENDASGTLVEN